jgi:tripartite-type tricarboxylate transporter receptor subunit TctC
VPAKTLAEFLAWAKQKGQISFGSPGVGTTPHLSAVMFVKRSGIDAVHVPFRGASQTIPAMLAGDVVFAIDNLASYVPVIQSGKMRALAVTSAQRWPTLPDVPTMGEAGIKDFVVTSWAAFVLPAGTPRPIIDKIHDDVVSVASEPSFRKKQFSDRALEPILSTPEEFARFLIADRIVSKRVVDEAGLQPQ